MLCLANGLVKPRDGAFDEETYVRYVQNAEGLSIAQYEARLRHDLLVQKMTELAFSSIAVSDDELKAEFVKDAETASIEFVRFMPGQFRGEAEATDADADAFLAAHAADVEKKFADTKFLYMEPRALKVRRLFEPVKSDATEAEQAAAKAKVEAAKKALGEGKSFDALVAEFAKDDSAPAKDGNIGWVSLGRSPFGLGQLLLRFDQLHASRFPPADQNQPLAHGVGRIG